MQKNIENELPFLLDADHISKILRVSKRVAYERMEEKGFPLIRVNRNKYVNRDDFFNWLESKKEIVS